MRSYVALVALVCLTLAGCTPLEKPASLGSIPYDRPSVEYTKTWDAALKVMGRCFMVRTQDMSRGTITAEPQLGSNPLAKYRTRVIAQLAKAGDGLWDVQVRVMNELEVSEPDTWGAAQPADEWVTVAFDKSLEAKLVNEINLERFGKPAWNTPNQYMNWGGTGTPAKHSDLLKALPKGGSTSYNPLSFDRDGTHLALLEQRPDFGDRYTQMIARGDIAFHNADYDGAATEYASAIEQAPNDPVAHMALCDVYLAQGRLDDAAHALRKAVTLGTDWLAVKFDRSKLYADPKLYTQRLAVLQKQVEQRSDHLAARLMLAYGLLCTGDHNACRSQLESLLKQDPRDSAARKLLDAIQNVA
jgi:tetratricopeptide (TPR) repeat protein